MQYNYKKELIYHSETPSSNAPFIVHLSGITMPNPNYFITQNTSTHDFFNRYQFEYVVSGKGYIIYDDVTYPLSKDDFFFLNKQIKVTYYSDKADPMKKYFTTVAGPLIDGCLNAYKITSPVIVRKIDVEKNFQSIFRCLENKAENYNSMLNNVAVEILKIIQKLYVQLSVPKINENDDKAFLIHQYIQQHAEEPLSLDSLANMFFLSKSQIIRIFSKRYHATPMNFYLKTRIIRALQYLERTDMTICQISDKLLFNDNRYFANTFKKYTGVTPTEYRKNRTPQMEESIKKFLNTIDSIENSM